MTDKAPARKVKTPEARALEQVAILKRRLAKLNTTKVTLQKQVNDLTPQIDAVTKRLTYAQANPDMPAAKDTPPPP